MYSSSKLNRETYYSNVFQQNILSLSLNDFKHSTSSISCEQTILKEDSEICYAYYFEYWFALKISHFFKKEKKKTLYNGMAWIITILEELEKQTIFIAFCSRPLIFPYVFLLLVYFFFL